MNTNDYGFSRAKGNLQTAHIIYLFVSYCYMLILEKNLERMVRTEYLPLHSAEKVKLLGKKNSSVEQPFPITIRTEIRKKCVCSNALSFLS